MSEPQQDPKTELLELDALAAEFGQKHAKHDPDDSPYKQDHRVADSLHGWSLHNYHYQADPVRLTRAVYQTALEAARGIKGSHPGNGHTPVKAAVATPPTRVELDQRIAAAAAQNAAVKADKRTADTASAAEDKQASEAPSAEKGTK